MVGLQGPVSSFLLLFGVGPGRPEEEIGLWARVKYGEERIKSPFCCLLVHFACQKATDRAHGPDLPQNLNIAAVLEFSTGKGQGEVV